MTALSLNLEGVQLIESESEIKLTQIAYSKDGQYLAAGYEDGTLKLFAMDSASSIMSAQVSDASITSLNFALLDSLIVGTDDNTKFTIFQLAESGVETVQSLSIVSPAPFLGTVDLEPSSSFLIVSNKNDSNMLAIHLQQQDSVLLFDHVAELDVKYPTLNSICTTKVSPQVTHIGAFCMHTEAIQLVNFSSSQVYPSNRAAADPAVVVQPKPVETIVKDVVAPVHTVVAPSPVHATSPIVVQPELQPKATQQQQQAEVESKPKQQGGLLSSVPFDMKQMEDNIVQRLAGMLENHSNKQFAKFQAKFEQERQERLKKEKERQEELLGVISHALASDIPDQLQSIVYQAIEQKVVPSVIQTVTQIVQHQTGMILPEVARKSIESTVPKLEKNISEAIHSTLQTSLHNVISSAVEPKIRETFQHSLKSTVIPSFEQSCQKMFQQIATTFDRCVDERVKQPLEEYYAQMNTQAVQIIQKEIGELKAAGGPTKAANNAKQPQQQTKQAPPPSKQNTKSNILAEVQSMIQKQQYENAYTAALSACDLQVVVKACSMVAPETLFAKQPCPLSQPVLLSLIQQLAFDLTTDVELKIRWLTASTAELNPNDPMIAAHVPTIMKQVYDNVAAVAKNPSASSSQFKLLLLALGGFK